MIARILSVLFVVPVALLVLVPNFMEPVRRSKKNRSVLQEGYLRAAEIHGDASADVNAITVKSHRNRTLAWAWENGYMDYLNSRGLTPDDEDMEQLTHNPYVDEDATNALLYYMNL